MSGDSNMKQYYVKVDFEYGVDNGDGTYTVKNDGAIRHVSMDYPSAVMLQNACVIPGFELMMREAGKLGALKSGIIEASPPGKPEK